ncbi:DUF5666 domain-containing protein [Actinomadura sp. DC4]|uniref:DUF5666 domain-containing protein n=1 Tax=Actinomadura sp. DC4 TaxID=3055069 RepID=UPI0025B0FBE8|nr:DUF5666 domain-containing protein [Actinomadura sp. DC4]MDN3354787.1 DUF5666 domain-containing protein [Actinomadura sp. DC4]
MSDSDERENDVSGRRRRVEPATEAVGEGDALATSPFEDDLAGEPAKAPRARRLPGVTTILCAGLVLAVGFLVGVQADRHSGNQGTSGAAPAAPGGAGTRGGGFPGQGQGRPGGATTGTVQRIEGKTIYVKTANGTVVPVKTTGTTKISAARKSSVKSLKSGTSVVVQGSQAQDGSVTATSVSQGTSSGG